MQSFCWLKMSFAIIIVRPVPANSSPSSSNAYYQLPSDDCKRPGTDSPRLRREHHHNKPLSPLFSLVKTNVRLRLREHLWSAFAAFVFYKGNNTAWSCTRPPHATSTATRNAKRASISQGRCLSSIAHCQAQYFLNKTSLSAWWVDCLCWRMGLIFRESWYRDRVL